MGGGASAHRPPPEPSAADVAALGNVFSKGDGTLCFFVLPADDEWKKRSSTMVLEVGSVGFRFLRPDTGDCLYLYPWGQIHSWTNTECKFTFRYYDDAKKGVVSYSVHMRDLGQLLGQIQAVIESILADRKSMAMAPERLAELLESLRGSGNALDELQRSCVKDVFMWAEQGRDVLDVLPTSFDKVEAAVLLHSHLIDQNRFSFMLEGLESQADRDNVWHRITAAKKQQQAKPNKA